MNNNQIRNDVKGFVKLKLEEILPFQGELKLLSEENYARLKNSIIDLGFSAPMFVWKNENKWFSLDGHQRCETLKRMKEEDGLYLEEIPCIEIDAKNIKIAKKKLLALTSQYGRFTKDGVLDFLSQNDLDILESAEMFVFPEIDWAKIIEEFALDGNQSLDAENLATVEINGQTTTLTDYILVIFEDTEESGYVRKLLGLSMKERTMKWSAFKQKVEDGEIKL